MMQRIRQRIRKRPWMVPALLLVLVFAMGLLVEAIKPMGGSAAKAGERFSDPPTNASKDYEDALGSPSSTRFNGRVWADKTVYTGSVTVDIPESEGKQITIPIENDDFLIAYSLLSSTVKVEGQSLVPLDVVFVIDLSDSMKGDRIKETVVALNQSVHTLMTGNPDNRIGVVTYSDEAQVLLPLGHYTMVKNAENYFTLSEAGDCLDVAVMNSSGQQIEASAKMGQWTNIHMGIDAGMDLLLSVPSDDITTISGDARYPALMLMSDGAPTASGGDASDWWNPDGVSGNGFVDSSGLDAFKAIMNASYQKQCVSQHYKQDMQVYTVGVGVESWDDTEGRETANITLNPEEWDKVGSPGLKELWEKWELYQTGENVTVGYIDRQYTFNHPPTDDVSSPYYNDGYFSAKNSEDIAEAFQQVLNQIVVSGAVPTQVGDDPTQSGYITYVDHIGQYMQVTAMRALVYKEKPFQFKGTLVSGNKTTYVYTGVMDGAVYQKQDVSDILITVTTDLEYPYGQTLEVKVPAALIPLRTNHVTLNEDGTVNTNICDNNIPLRLFYSVRLRDEVVTTVNNQRYANISRLSSEYIENHTNEDDSIRFNPNLYTGRSENQAGVEATVGDAYITFDPATTNPFYSVQQDTLLYSDSGCNTPATDINGPLYIKVPYYDGTKLTFDALERTGMYQLGDDGEVKMVDKQLYLKAGVRANLRESVMEKGEDEHGVSNNRSGTAETYRYPIYIEKKPEDIGEKEAIPPYGNNGEKGDVLVYLGNNGVVSLPVLTGDLSISKTVTGNMLKQVENQEFVFDINVFYENSGTRVNLNGTYETSANGGSVVQPSTEPSFKPGEETITFVDGKAQVTLSHGESITVHDLPAGYTYVVTEQDPKPGIEVYNDEDYFVSVTQSSSPRGEDGTTNSDVVAEANTSVYTCTGTIQADRVETVAYTNYLEVPIADITFTKVDGFDFNSEDTAKITPLPGAEFKLYRYMGKSWETDKGTTMNPSSEYDIWKQMGDAVLSDENGVVTFTELQAGNYRLVETSAPDGYQLPDGQWNITLTISKEDSGYVGDIGAPEAVENPPAFSYLKGNKTYYLMNYKPINPPITGGDGGEDFRIGGSLLMFTGLVLAMWWMWSSPRRRSEFL